MNLPHAALGPIVVGVALLIAGCGAVTTSTASPPTTAASAAPNTTATPTPPAATGTAPPTSQPTRTPALPELSVGDVVETAVDGLQLRDGPSLSAPSQGYLTSGVQGVVIEGPTEADGYPWYRIGSVGLPWGTGCSAPDDDGRFNGSCFNHGWVAAAGQDGTAWLVAPREPCPGVPTSVAELAVIAVGIASSCFGDGDLVLAAYLSPETEGRGCYPGYDHVPDWLGPCPIVFLQGTETEFEAQGPEMVANLHPELGACDFGGQSPDTCPVVPYRGQWITVTGHFHDPAASTCTIVPWDGNEHAPDEALGRHACRLRLVLTQVLPAADR